MGHKNYIVNLYNTAILCLSNSRRFGSVVVEKFPKHWVHHWVVGYFAAKSAKHPLLIEIHRAYNLFDPCRILPVGGEYMLVLRKICFIKKYVFLRKLRKCIIGWWMTVLTCKKNVHRYVQVTYYIYNRHHAIGYNPTNLNCNPTWQVLRLHFLIASLDS